MVWISFVLPSTPAVVFAAFVLAAIVLVIVVVSRRPRVPPGLKLPPGPWGLPIIGAAFRLGEESFKDLTELAKEYGQIFSLYIGSRLVVVLNGSDVINEALVKNSAAFAGRPSLFTMSKASYGGRGILNTDYGKKWQVLRKTSVSAIHKYLVSKDIIQSILSKTRDDLIEQLKAYTNQAHDPMPELKLACAGVILGILFGDRCDKKDFDQVLALSDNFRETVGAGMAIDFMPWLQYFPNSDIEKLNELLIEVKEIISRLYYENRVTYTKGKIRNLADSLLEGIENLQTERALEDKQTVCNSHVDFRDLPTEHLDSISALSDLFGAGFDTTSITLYFAIAYLAVYPKVQNKVKDEVDQVIGRGRKPEVDDLKELHYCKAFLYELLRITSLVPLSMPHSTTTDVTLQGHFIPKGTVIFVNQWSVLQDPQLYKNPEVFNPNRFLDDNGHVVHPKNLAKFIPFGVGRRACPGKDLAEKELLFILTSLVHHFEFTSDTLQENKIKIEVGLTLKPESYTVQIIER